MAEMTKREIREVARRERREREAALARRHHVQRRVLWAVALLAVIAVVAVVGYLVYQSARPTIGVAQADEGRTHVTEGSPIEYKNQPPSSGPHYPRTAPYGFHDQPIAPGYWVHNLEHGGIVILYNCPTDCPELKDQLRQVYDTFPKGKYDRVKIVILPDTSISTPLVALAWDYKLELQAFDREQLLAFYNEHVDRGPEDVP